MAGTVGRTVWRIAPTLGCGFALLALWELAVVLFHLPPYLLPAPGLVFRRVLAEAPLLARHGLRTAQVIFLGFAVSAAAGIVLGVAASYSRRLGKAIYPLLVLTHAIPKVAFAPMLVLWLGYGWPSKVAVVVLMATFPIMAATVLGMRAADPQAVSLLRTMTTSERQIFFKLRLPQASPAIFSGLKVGASSAGVGTVVGEFVASDGGLGYLVMAATAHLDTPMVFAAVSGACTLTVLFYYLVAMAESMVDPRLRRQRAHRPRRRIIS